MTDIVAAISCLGLVALFIVASIWYFKRIRDGRADPIINPSWTSNMRPASPPPPLFEQHPTRDEHYRQLQEDGHLLSWPDDDPSAPDRP